MGIMKEDRFWEVIKELRGNGVDIETRQTEFGIYFDIKKLKWSCEQIFNDCSYNGALTLLEGILFGVKLKKER